MLMSKPVLFVSLKYRFITRTLFSPESLLLELKMSGLTLNCIHCNYGGNQSPCRCAHAASIVGKHGGQDTVAFESTIPGKLAELMLKQSCSLH